MKDEKSEKIYYKTSSINLASTLYTIGFPISGIHSKENSTISEFYFEVSTKLERAVDDFWGRRLKVEPNTLLINRKEILLQIKSEKKSLKKSFKDEYKNYIPR